MATRNFKASASAACIALALGAVSLDAAAFGLGGYQGAVEIQYNGFTTTSPGAGAGFGNETTWGAGFMTNIFEFGNPSNVLWDQSSTGETIGFMLYGIADGNITGAPPNVDIFNIGCTGGSCDGKIHIDFYLNPTGGSFNDTTAAGLSTSDRTGFSTMNQITDGSLLMSWEMVPGIQTIDVAGGTNPAFDERTAVLTQNVSSATLPATGDGDFYADCVAGPACSSFDTDGFVLASNTADFFGQFSLSANLSQDNLDNGWQGRISDPVEGAVPEPGILALFGIGAAGFGMAARRRKSQTA